MIKYLLILAAITIFPVNSSFAKDKSLPANLIPNSFETIKELKEWTNKSAFGGGKLIELQGKIGKYFVADRMHTSGVLTSEAVIYKKDNEIYKMVYYLQFRHW